MLKKWTLLSLVMLMVIVSACSNGGKNDPKPSNTASENDTPTTAASDSPEQAKGDPYGRYEQPIKLSLAKAYNTKDLKLPNGDTVGDNEYFRYVEKKLNVKVDLAWQVETPEAYDQKVGVTIASRSLPDAFVVNEQQLKQLVAADLIEDLTDAYENNVNDYLRGVYDSYDDRVLGRATFKGKLMALPTTQIGQQMNITWIRQDWMDTYGLQAPQSLDDVINIAKTFIDKDASGKGTVGFTGVPDLAGWNMVHGFDPILGALNAYKSQWLKDDFGNIVYSSTMPEMKTALAKLHELYGQGIIDKEFALRKDPNELVANNQVGIVFGPWWIPYWPLVDSLANDPKAEWKPFLAPFDADGKFNSTDQDPVGGYLVVRKGYEHPEAVVRVMNVQYDGIRSFDPESAKITTETYKDVIGLSWALWPFTIQVGPEGTVYETHAELKSAVDAKDPSTLNAELQSWYNDVMKNIENPKKDVNVWANSMARMEGSELMGSDKINMIRNQFFGKTKTMDQKWAILQKLEKETFLKIIMGESPVDEFDKFVEKWNSLGGKQITQEITEIINSK